MRSISFKWVAECHISFLNLAANALSPNAHSTKLCWTVQGAFALMNEVVINEEN